MPSAFVEGEPVSKIDIWATKAVSEPNSKPRALRVLLGAFAAFIAIVQIILFLATASPGHTTLGWLPPAEIISLIGGGVTVAGLYALFVQLQAAETAAERARQQDEQRREQQRLDAALRLDRLHDYFNSIDMRRSRDLGWKYLQYLQENPEQLMVFARHWVYSEGSPATPPAERKKSAPSFGITDFSHYTWAMSLIIAFFVRLNAHLKLKDAAQSYQEDELEQAVGPFFWGYWRKGLLQFEDACQQLIVSEGRDSPNGALYFAGPLRSLDRLIFPKQQPDVEAAEAPQRQV